MTFHGARNEKTNSGRVNARPGKLIPVKMISGRAKNRVLGQGRKSE